MKRGLEGGFVRSFVTPQNIDGLRVRLGVAGQQTYPPPTLTLALLLFITWTMQKLLWLPAAERSVLPINPRDWLSDGLTPYYELIVRTTQNSRLAYYIVHPRNISTILLLYYSPRCFYCRSIMTMECRPWRFLLLYKQSVLKRLTQLACTDKRINIPLFKRLDIASFPMASHAFSLLLLKVIFVFTRKHT